MNKIVKNRKLLWNIFLQFIYLSIKNKNWEYEPSIVSRAHKVRKFFIFKKHINVTRTYLNSGRFGSFFEPSLAYGFNSKLEDRIANS